MNETKFRDWLLMVMIPVTQWIGRQHYPLKHHRISTKDYVQIRSVLERGMVFLTRRSGELNNVFIPGFWTHAALYAGDEIVLEATAEGVIKTSLEEFLCGRKHGKDYVAVLDPTFVDEPWKQVAVAIARLQVGDQYDWVFEPNNQAFYCAELVWYAYEQAYRRANLNAPSPFTLRTTMGVETATPQDFANATEKWRSVYVSAGATRAGKVS